MLKNAALLFVFSMLLATIGVAQEDGWTTLPVGQSVYGIRYDQHGAIIVNNDLIMGCVVDPQSPDDTKVYISPPSPLKKYVMVMCWDRGGKEAYVIDIRKNKVASRDVVPKHWRVIKWVSWSPDERFALVAAAGEITMGDMAFVDLTSGKLQEINFKNFTNDRGIDPRKAIFNRIQDFDISKVSWLSPSSFRLNMDVRCNPYEVEGDCYEKVISSHPLRVNLAPFSIVYGGAPQRRADRPSRQKTFTINRECDSGLCHFEIVSFNYSRDTSVFVGIGDPSLSYYFSVQIKNGRISREYIYSDAPNEHFVEKESGRSVNTTLNRFLLDVYNLGRYIVNNNIDIRNRRFSETGRFAVLANLRAQF